MLIINSAPAYFTETRFSEVQTRCLPMSFDRQAKKAARTHFFKTKHNWTITTPTCPTQGSFIKRKDQSKQKTHKKNQPKNEPRSTHLWNRCLFIIFKKQNSPNLYTSYFTCLYMNKDKIPGHGSLHMQYIFLHTVCWLTYAQYCPYSSLHLSAP